MKNRAKRTRIQSKIYAFDLVNDIYIVIKQPFNEKKHLVYIRAADENEARKKIKDKYNQFLINKALKNKNII